MINLMCFHACNNNIIIQLNSIIHIWIGRDVPLIQPTRTFLNVKRYYVLVSLSLLFCKKNMPLSVTANVLLITKQILNKVGNRITEVSQHPLNIRVLKHNSNLLDSSTQTSLRSCVPQYESFFSWSSLATFRAIVSSSSSQMSLSKARRRSFSSTKGSLNSLGFSCSGSSLLFFFARVTATLESLEKWKMHLCF